MIEEINFKKLINSKITDDKMLNKKRIFYFILKN